MMALIAAGAVLAGAVAAAVTWPGGHATIAGTAANRGLAAGQAAGQAARFAASRQPLLPTLNAWTG
jgi:hypothetical protein